MKKELTLSIIFILCCLIGQSQITVTQSDMPMIGDSKAFVDVANISGVSIGTSGANQTWDFSNLMGVDTFLENYVTPLGTPGFDDFPSSNIAYESGGDYVYLEINSNAMNALGLSTDTSGMGDYFSFTLNPDQKFFELPTTYGTTFSDDWGFTLTIDGSVFGVDSVRTINHSLTNVTYDGYGTIIMPSGSFDGLREERITTTYDSTQVLFFGVWTTLESGMSMDTSYSWIAKNSKGPLVNVEIENGMVSSASYYILEPVVIAPTANFSFSDQGMGTVDFTDLSANQPTSWFWDFGDGGTSTEQNPQYIFTSPGAYNVCLTVTNGAGSDMVCMEVVIVFAPTADFSFTDQSMGTFDFMDLSSNNPTSWLWEFGDGNTSNLQNPQHTFATSGMYEVCLTVTNSAGSDMTCQTLDVMVTSTTDIFNELDIEVYPNPASDQVMLDLEILEWQGSLSLEWYNTLGQPSTKIEVLKNGVYVFDVSDWSSGHYYYYLKDRQGIIKARGSFVKQ